MSVEENKAISRRFTEEFINKKRQDVLPELLSPDCVTHDATFPGSVDSAMERFRSRAFSRTSFPDLHSTIEEMIAEGDMVVQRVTGRATHQGEFMGIPPTGKQVTWRGIIIHRIVDGKIVDIRAMRDTQGILEQLRADPAPER